MTDAPPPATAPATIRVLLVDDQRIVAEAVRRMLADQPDISLHYVADPADALRMALQLQPAVILQDLVMPGIDGLDLIKTYRGHEELRAVPVIVLSSTQDQQQMERCFACGVSDYLVKLPNKATLLARVRYHAGSTSIYSTPT